MRVLLLNLLFCFCCVNGLKILCIFPLPGYSHYTIGYSLMKQLAEKGHNVTLVAPFKEKEPTRNLRTIYLTGIVEEFNEMMKNQTSTTLSQRSSFATILFLGMMASVRSDNVLSHENMQNLLKSEEKFDVVIVEHFGTEALQAVANHFNAQSVLLSAIGPSILSNYLFGNPDIPSYMTNIMLDPPVHTSFWRRLHNYVLYLFTTLLYHFYYIPKQNEVIHKHFPNAPHIYDIIYNNSLILYNSDESYNEPIPLLPNMINIGGLHVETPKPLPTDLRIILDNAQNGVIYFSMGSFLKCKDFSATMRKDILHVMSQLRETILWKFEEELPEKPHNVEIRNWFPQTDVLAHPNVKLFITHGGLFSTIEALARGVPVIGLPVFGDQASNMMNAVRRGQGLMIPFREFSKERFSEALHEVLNNPKYSENAKLSSKILLDSPLSPVDTAEYWLEYVVRYNGAKHLRSAALDLTWFQLQSFDVILFLIAMTVTSFYVFYIIVRRMLIRKKTLKLKSN